MKIITIIQARTGSERLPNKVNAKIGDNTLLSMVVERCLKATVPEMVIMALHGYEGHMEVPKPNDRLKIVEGPEEPAARFLKVLAEYPCDGFVRVCADSPFIDPEIIDQVAEDIQTMPTAYIPTTHSIISGNQAEAFNTREFLWAESSMTDEEREHLGLYFRRKTRLTVDTPADLERARLIVSRMDKDHTEYTAAECLSLLHG